VLVPVPRLDSVRGVTLMKGIVFAVAAVFAMTQEERVLSHFPGLPSVSPWEIFAPIAAVAGVVLAVAGVVLLVVFLLVWAIVSTRSLSGRGKPEDGEGSPPRR
jgi:hypothetical protein